MTYNKPRPDVKLNTFEFYVENDFQLLKLDNRADLDGQPNPGLGKRPLKPNWQRTKGISRESAVDYAKRGHNIGAAIPSGVVVLDIDPRNGGGNSIQRLLDHASAPDLSGLIKQTYSVRTGGGGWHLYFRSACPLSPVGKIDGYPGVDVLSSGRQVVTPGSVSYTTGDHYKWSGHSDEIADLPAELEPFIFKNTHLLNDEARAPRKSDGAGLFGIIDADELETLLGALNPKHFRDYNTQWLPTLCAAHHATGGDELARAVFATWSRADENYGEAGYAAAEKKWDTAHEYRTHDGELATVRTLLNAVETTCRQARLKSSQDDAKLGLGTSLCVAEKLCHDTRGRIVAQELEQIDTEPTDEILDLIDALQPGFERSAPDIYERIVKRAASEADRVQWPTIASRLADKRFDRLQPGKIEKEIKRIRSDLDKQSKQSGGAFTHLEIQKALTEQAIEKHSDGNPLNLNTPPNKQLYRYQEGVWKKDDWHEVEASCYQMAKMLVDDSNKAAKFLPDYARKAKEAVMLETASNSVELYNRSELPSCVNLKNGTLWIDPKTGDKNFKIHRRKDFLTTQLPYDYDEGETCPAFDTMLEQVFAHVERDYSRDAMDELIRHFWELVGYMIQPNKNLPRILIWTGAGQNGKSRIAQIITRLVGDGNWLAADVGQFFSDSRPHNIPFAENKLIFLDDDVKADTLLNDGALKKCSENKQLEANPKNRDAYQASLFLTPILITNSRIRLDDTSYGMTRRLDVIKWATDITHLQGSPLPDLVEAEQMPGVLNRAIDGLSRLRKRGEFAPPACLEDYKNELLASSNSVFSFWASLTKMRCSGHKEDAQDLYARYVAYMTTIGDRRWVPNMFRFVDMIGKLADAATLESVTGWIVA